MGCREADVLIERMVGVIEQSHRLQLEMLEMWRAVLNVSNRLADSPTVHTPEGSSAAVLPDRPTFTVAETAALLGVSRDAAYDAIRRGEISSLRLGHRILIPRSALTRLLSAA